MGNVVLEDYGLSVSDVFRNLERKRENGEWLRKNTPSLRKQFAEKYVAVSEGKVVAVANNLSKLFKTLKKQGCDQKEVSTFAIDLITREDVIWIL